MAPMQSKSTSQPTVSPSSLSLASCDCPDRMKEGSILYNLLSSSAHEPIGMDTSSSSSSSSSGGSSAAATTTVTTAPTGNPIAAAAAAAAAPTERRYPTGVSSVSQAVSQALWRRGGAAALIPPAVIALKHQEVICQQAAQLLLKTVDFVRNSPSCQRLCPADRVTLFQHCWAELLVLMMTQYRFQFETEDVEFDFGADAESGSGGGEHQQPSCHHCRGHSGENMLLRCLVALQGIPTQSDIHMMDCFFSKCELMGLDDKEYAYLKMTILFNPDIPGLVDPVMVEALQSEAQLRLSEYVAAARPLDPLRFARVLLSLPPLRNIRSRVISQLFFQDLIGGVPMEDLLEQMVGVH